MIPDFNTSVPGQLVRVSGVDCGRGWTCSGTTPGEIFRRHMVGRGWQDFWHENGWIYIDLMVNSLVSLTRRANFSVFQPIGKHDLKWLFRWAFVTHLLQLWDVWCLDQKQRQDCCTGHAKDLHAAMALSSLDVGLLKLQAPNLWCLRSYISSNSVGPGPIVIFGSQQLQSCIRIYVMKYWIS